MSPFSGRRPGWYTWAVLFVTCVLSVIIGQLLAAQRSDRNDRRLCASIQADVNAYFATPPVTPAGLAQRDSKMKLLRDLGCPADK